MGSPCTHVNETQCYIKKLLTEGNYTYKERITFETTYHFILAHCDLETSSTLPTTFSSSNNAKSITYKVIKNF